MYAQSIPPHSDVLLQQLKAVSDEWLAIGEHTERGFALGYFDEEYMHSCNIHYLYNEQGKILAFTNQLPQFRVLGVATVDLLRYLPEAKNAMPFLLLNTIEQSRKQGYGIFDLGFVPFAKAKGPLLNIVQVMSTGRFSAKGLEQFKNKFDPLWRVNYMAYDGDLADLALIAINLERAVDIKS
jgi:phosphatidylglycerol lysyltransferase